MSILESITNTTLFSIKINSQNAKIKDLRTKNDKIIFQTKG